MLHGRQALYRLADVRFPSNIANVRSDIAQWAGRGPGGGGAGGVLRADLYSPGHKLL